MQASSSSLLSRGFLLVALLVTAINFLSMPGTPGGGDAMYVRYEAMVLINHGTIAIPPQVSGIGDKGQFFYYNEAKGRWYSKYGILNTLMFLPALYGEKLATGQLHADSAGRVSVLNGMNLLLALAVTAYLFKFTGLYVKSLRIRTAWILAAFYSTFWWNYLRYPSFEAYQPFFLIGSAYHLIRALDAPAGENKTNVPLHLFFSGLLLGLLVLSKTLYVLAAALFAALILCFEWNKLHSAGNATRLRLLWFAAPLLACFCALLAVNNYKFGSPFNTGYTQWQREHDLFSGNLLEGITGFLFDPQFSIFLTFPVLIAALFGLREFFKKHRLHAIVIYSLAALLLLANAKFFNWRGQWACGPRYMLPVLGMMSLPFLFVIEKLAANIRKPACACAAVAIAALLAFSTKLQLNTNALPFYAVQSVYETAVLPLHDAQLDSYFAKMPMGLICGDLLGYKRNTPTWLTRRALEATNGQYDARARLSFYFRKYTASNYYLFPDPKMSAQEKPGSE